MANKVDHAIHTITNKPIFSGLSTIFGTAAIVGFLTATNSDMLATTAFFTGAASPIVTAGLTMTAGVALFRERSKLSKAFSTAAVATGVAGGIAFASQIGAPGWEGAAAFISTLFSMTAAGAFNLAAHYTQNKNLKINVSTDETDTNDVSTPKPGGGTGPY